MNVMKESYIFKQIAGSLKLHGFQSRCVIAQNRIKSYSIALHVTSSSSLPVYFPSHLILLISYIFQSDLLLHIVLNFGFNLSILITGVCDTM